jgi:hypothetical protein
MKHKNCEYCKTHNIDLNEKLFIHGKYFTKGEIVEALSK